jgi:hypothetical protein
MSSDTCQIAPESIAYEIHPAAKIFPMMADPDVAALRDDIKQHGQREPIELLDGKVIDGRNRLAACLKSGVQPAVREIDGDGLDPIAYVLSKNLHRRHLSESQRAMVAVSTTAALREMAAERQRSGTLAPHGAKVAEQAAIACGVGTRTVERAIKVSAEGAPEVAEAIQNGKISVACAERLVRHIPKHKQQAGIIARATKCESTRGNDQLVDAEIHRAVSRRNAAMRREDQADAQDEQEAQQPASPAEVLTALSLSEALLLLNDSMRGVYQRWPATERVTLASKLRSWSAEIYETNSIAAMERPVDSDVNH